MQNPQDDIWKPRLIAAAAALLVAYSVHPITSVLLMALEEFGLEIGGAFMPALLVLQAIVFGLALLWLLKTPDTAHKFERATLWTGICLLMLIPLLIGLMFLEAASDNSPDQGGAVAGFFMVIIFGGFYGVQGIALLITSFVLRKRRKETPVPRKIVY